MLILERRHEKGIECGVWEPLFASWDGENLLQVFLVSVTWYAQRRQNGTSGFRGVFTALGSVRPGIPALLCRPSHWVLSSWPLATLVRATTAEQHFNLGTILVKISHCVWKTTWWLPTWFCFDEIIFSRENDLIKTHQYMFRALLSQIKQCKSYYYCRWLQFRILSSTRKWERRAVISRVIDPLLALFFPPGSACSSRHWESSEHELWALQLSKAFARSSSSQ